MKRTKLKITARANGQKAVIKIADIISTWSETSANEIRKIVNSLIGQGLNEAEVYINSQGGSVFETTEIANELKRFEKVSIIIGAVAASAATYLVAKYPASAYSNSQLMIHRPKLGTFGNISQIEADLKLLKNITDDYCKVYAQKTGKTEADIEELWKDGDYWMTAQEAKDLGLIDTIIAQEESLTEESVAVLEACGAPVIPKINKTKNEDSNIMDKKELIASLGLAADATDEQIKQKIADNKAKAEEAERLQAQAEVNKKAIAEALVDKAITDKKITAQQKDSYMKLAEADFENTKAVLEAMPKVEALSSVLNTSNGSHAGVDSSKASWTLEDWLDKDPKGLAEMEKSNPEAFVKLNEEYYK